jgi:flagellar protein FlaG
MNEITSIERFPAETPRMAQGMPPALPAAPAAAQPVAKSEAPQAVQQGASPADVRFEVDHAHERVVIRFSDPATGEVVRQIPSEVLLRVAEMIADARGGTVDARV